MTDDIVTRLRRDCISLIADEAAAEIERLRQLSGEAGQLREERDEARRWCCRLFPAVFFGHKTAEEQAAAQNWDCFKEDTDGK